MIFLKSYFVATTGQTDIIPIIHDVRFAIRDSQLKEGLVTVTLPDEQAALVVAAQVNKENLPNPQRSLSLPFKNGELVLEPKQMIFLIDENSDAKRREFFVQVMGEKPAAATTRGTPPRRPR
ncbi:MAG: hypothetical protein HY466_05400 [Deltaproteobacteria bacterium]|nr:hypothetical protein [Deltaproteobacteria bacterium]